MPRQLRAFHPDVRGSGVEARLDAEESHHVARVLRLSAGDALTVFDGKGREWNATVLSATRDAVVVRIGEECPGIVEASFPVEIFQSLCRPERIEWAIQKATELGVAAIRLCETARSERHAPSEERLARWRRLAREACKQCGRRRIPEVDDAIDVLPAAPEGTLALALHTGPGVPPIGEVLRGPAPGGVWLLVGPEGGLEDEEVRTLAGRGWRPAGLGPRALRAETAGIVAAGLVLNTWGDLGRFPAP